MASENNSELFSQLERGSIRSFLRTNRFPAWIHLASTTLLERELATLCNVNKATLRMQCCPTQVHSLAQRLILSRRGSLLATLRPLWQAFGSSGEICNKVVEAVQISLVDWPSDVTRIGAAGTGDPTFSPAIAEFVDSLRAVATGDAEGILGTAVRTSRIADERPHLGFPMVLRGSFESNLRRGIWVTPTASQSLAVAGELQDAWTKLYARVHFTVHGAQSSHEPDLSLPDLLQQLSCRNGWNIETLESAGLGLAIQMLAQKAKANLPFGIGFTGRWKGEQLRGVRDLAIKLQAATEAGVFLLIACANPNESLPKPIDGIRLVLLPEGLCLKDVVRYVNRACADSGLTEFRWREAQRRFRAASPATTAHSPDLPEALNETLCPIGFIGRNQALQELELAAADGSQGGGRRLVAIIAPARSGKTTLLSRFASERATFPIWFSFRRGQATRQNLAQLHEAVRDQITARFVAVPFFKAPTLPAETMYLERLLGAVSGRIDVVVDGLDEAASPKECRDILSWLQQLHGDGVVIVGSQPISEIETVDCRKINLQSDNESGQADARELIASFAQHFSNNAHLCDIAQKLQKDWWIDGLVDQAGGNLWVLTEFLSALEVDRAGWPSTPSEAGLSPDVRKYCRNLVTTVLAGYDFATQLLIERFLAFRAFLGNQPWNVTDVVALADDSLTSAPFGTWSGTGVLAGSTRRVIQFDGQHCRFWSPLTREAVQSHYQTETKAMAARLVARIGEDQSESEFAKHLLETVSMLLSEGGDAEMVRQLLFETSWLHRRMRMLATQGQPMAAVQDELTALKQVAAYDALFAINQMADWITCWGWAIDEDPDLLDQWWDAAGEITRPFKRFEVARAVTAQHRGLLTPVAGPGISDAHYSVSFHTPLESIDAFCQIMDGNTSCLVFADSGIVSSRAALLVCRDSPDGYVRDRHVSLPAEIHLVTLAPLRHPEVAALLEVPKGQVALAAIDISSGRVRTLLRDSKLIGLESLPSDPPQLLVLWRESPGSRSSAYSLGVLDARAQIHTEISLPFAASEFDRVEIVPFGTDCFCVLGRIDPHQPREMRLYRLEAGSESHRLVEFQSPEISRVDGACALPGQRLVVTHLGTEHEESFLAVINDSGAMEFRNPLSHAFESVLDGSRPPLAIADRPSCKPLAWHAELGVLLAIGWDPWECTIFSIQPVPEARPFGLPAVLSPAITGAIQVRSIADGQVLSTVSTCAYVLGPSEQDGLYIECGPVVCGETKIVGCLADGEIVVRSDNSCEIAVPPFKQGPPQYAISRTSQVEVTADGWVLQWNRDGCVLTGSTQSDELAFRWNATAFFGGDDEINRAVILDVIGRPPECGAWVAIRFGQRTYIAMLSFSPADVQANIQPAWTGDIRDPDTQVSFESASANLLAYRVGGAPASLNNAVRMLHSKCGIVHSWKDDLTSHWDRLTSLLGSPEHGVDRRAVDPSVCVYDLNDSVSLVTKKVRSGDDCFTPADVFIYSQETGLVERRDLRFSRVVEVIRPLEPGGRAIVRVASIIQQGRQRNLIVSALQIIETPQIVMLRSVEEVHLGYEVKCWTRFDDYVVLAYSTGRVETRRLNRPKDIIAVCYTASPPRQITTTCRDEGNFLVITTDDRIYWYRL